MKAATRAWVDLEWDASVRGDLECRFFGPVEALGLAIAPPAQGAMLRNRLDVEPRARGALLRSVRTPGAFRGGLGRSVRLSPTPILGQGHMGLAFAKAGLALSGLRMGHKVSSFFRERATDAPPWCRVCPVRSSERLIREGDGRELSRTASLRGLDGSKAHDAVQRASAECGRRNQPSSTRPAPYAADTTSHPCPPTSPPTFAPA